MALSTRTKDILTVAMADKRAATELSAAINSGSNPQATVIAALGTTSALSAAAVTATVIGDAAVTATNVPASNFTASIPSAPTKAEVDAGIDTVVLAIEGALDLKADNADLNTMKAAVVSALDLKADNADVETLRTQAEARLDAIEAKLDALLAALKTANLMASA